MGSDHPYDYPGSPKRHPTGFAIRMEIEADKPECEGETGQRVSSTYCGADAW